MQSVYRIYINFRVQRESKQYSWCIVKIVVRKKEKNWKFRVVEEIKF